MVLWQLGLGMRNEVLVRFPNSEERGCHPGSAAVEIKHPLKP